MNRVGSLIVPSLRCVYGALSDCQHGEEENGWIGSSGGMDGTGGD
jgi:hypothetical protein